MNFEFLGFFLVRSYEQKMYRDVSKGGERVHKSPLNFANEDLS